jgi:hypothetical protein
MYGCTVAELKRNKERSTDAKSNVEYAYIERHLVGILLVIDVEINPGPQTEEKFESWIGYEEGKTMRELLENNKIFPKVL